jgi:predicted NBD/HSP70 family sugar kinase
MTERSRSTVRDLRRTNRSALLWELCFAAPLTRPDLSRTTGLSLATVSNLVTDFLAEGVVVETGSVSSDGGRPRTLLTLNPTHRYLIGVDVGETRVRIELFDLALTTLGKLDHPLKPNRHGIDLIVRHVADGIRAVLDQSGVAESTVAGVGVAVPGVVTHDPEAVVDAQAFGWDRAPIERLLRRRTTLPLHIDNGAQSMGRAEMWFGAGKGRRNTVIALIGSGVGASIVIDGRTYRGAGSSAGEWGHTTVHLDGLACRCGARGCLEAYVGAEGILSRYRQAAKRRKSPAEEDEEAELNALLRAAGRSTVAATVLADTARYLGAGVADLINLFSPEAVILGGWAGLALGQHLLPEIRAAAQRHALRAPFARTSIELGQLGPDAVTLGAATLPLERLLNGATTTAVTDGARTRLNHEPR